MSDLRNRLWLITYSCCKHLFDALLKQQIVFAHFNSIQSNLKSTLTRVYCHWSRSVTFSSMLFCKNTSRLTISARQSAGVREHVNWLALQWFSLLMKQFSNGTAFDTCTTMHRDVRAERWWCSFVHPHTNIKSVFPNYLKLVVHAELVPLKQEMRVVIKYTQIWTEW